MATFLNNRKETADRIDKYLTQFDLLRKVAENKMGGERTFPPTFTAILRKEPASLTHNQKAPVLAITQGCLDLMKVSRRMRRLVDSLGSGNRKDVFAAVSVSAAIPPNNEGPPSNVAPRPDGGGSAISPDD